MPFYMFITRETRVDVLTAVSFLLTCLLQFLEAAKDSDSGALDRVMASYGEEVVAAVGSEIDRLEKEIQRIVPAILHVDIEAHNPNGPVPREKFYLHAIGSAK